MDSYAASQRDSVRTQSLDMDGLDHAVKVQRVIGNNRVDSPVAMDGDVIIYKMVASKEKLEYMWRQSVKHKSLFWHSKMGSQEMFADAMLNPSWVFFEVYKFGYLCGFVYFTDVKELEYVQMHAIFFDRALTDKLIVGKLLIHWMFDHYPIERIEAAIAEPFHATHRFVQKLGMKYEGIRRKGILLYGAWTDQKIFSVIREEV